MEESVLLGTKPLVDSIRHFIRYPSGVFSVFHLVRVVSFNDVTIPAFCFLASSLLFRIKVPYNKKNITRWLEDMNFLFSWQEQYLQSFASLTREILPLPLEHKIHIFSPPCNILYIFLLPLCNKLKQRLCEITESRHLK